MCIHRYLEASTAALGDHERDLLDEGDFGGWIHDTRRYGWWVWVPTDPDPERIAELARTHPRLAALIRKAASATCTWLMLDPDAPDNDTTAEVSA